MTKASPPKPAAAAPPGPRATAPGRSRISIWPVHPNAGAGELTFGMKRSRVTGLMGEQPDGTDGVHDFYLEAGVKLGFDDEDRLELITLMAPAQPTFKDKLLLGEPYRDLVAWLTPLDKAVDEGFGDAATFHTLGITLHRGLPDLEQEMLGEEEDPFLPIGAVVPPLPNRVDAVSVFDRDYVGGLGQMLAHIQLWSPQ